MSEARIRGSSATAATGRSGAFVLVGVAAFALVLGVLTGLRPGAAAAVVAAVVLVALLSSARSRLAPADLGAKHFRWLAVAWAFLLIHPIGHFTSGRTDLSAVAGVPSIENVLDLGSNALIGLMALWSLRSNRFVLRPPWLVLALPVLALLSAAWSLAPTVTLGFSFELLVISLLVILTSAILRADRSLGWGVVCRTLRLVVLGVAFLCVVGLIFRGSWITPGSSPRFAWPGAHPLACATEVGLSFLIIVFARRCDIGFSLVARISLVTLFAACLYLGTARSTFVGLVVASLFAYWFLSKGSGAARRMAGAVAIGATVFVLVASFGGPVTEYLYRGQTQQQVYALSGRLGLWTFALSQIHSSGRWLVGYGLSGDRVLFASTVAWAGDAHSAWMELLLSLGLVGVALGLALVVTLAVRLFRMPADGPPGSRVLPILFVYLVAISPAITGYAAPGPEPGLGFALLGLCYAATTARERAPSRAAIKRSPRVDSRLQPAPT